MSEQASDRPVKPGWYWATRELFGRRLVNVSESYADPSKLIVHEMFGGSPIPPESLSQFIGPFLDPLAEAKR